MLSLLATPALAASFDVLLVGNSYTSANDLDQQLEGDLLEVPRWAEASVQALTADGWTWSDHLAAADGSRGDSAWSELLGEDAQDAVVLQEQSQTPGLDASSPEWLASLDALRGLDQLVQQSGADTVLMMTWGRRDGDATLPDLYPDYGTMQDRLEAGTLAYAAALASDGRSAAVAPVGRAWRAVYEAAADEGVDPAQPGTPFWELYAADGSHPSPYGSFLVRSVLYATLCGRDPSSLELPETPLDAARLQDLRRMAADAVLSDPFGDIDYPWALEWDELGDADPLVIGSAGLRPVVRMNGSDSVGTLQIGVTEALWAGDGELWIEDGAELDVDEVVLGDGGPGIVRHHGGQVSVRSAIVATDSEWTQDGGVLSVRSFIGHLEQRGGTLKALGPATLQDWTQQRDAVLAVTPGAGQVIVSGSASLHGTVALGACVEGRIVDVLAGATLDAADVTVSGCDTARLVVGDEGIDVRIDDAAVDADGAGPHRGGCGCGTGGSPFAVGWLALLGFATRRQRREAQPDLPR